MNTKLLFSIPLFFVSFFIQAQEPLKKLYQVGTIWFGENSYIEEGHPCARIHNEFHYEVKKDTVIDNLIYSKIHLNRTFWRCIRDPQYIFKIELEDFYVRQVGGDFMKFDFQRMEPDTFFAFLELKMDGVVRMPKNKYHSNDLNSPIASYYIKSIDTLKINSENKILYGLAYKSGSSYIIAFYYIDGIGFYHSGADPRAIYGTSERPLSSQTQLNCFSNGINNYSFEIDGEYPDNTIKPKNILNSTTFCQLPLSIHEETETNLDFVKLKENELVTKKVADKVVVFDAMGKVVTTNENSKITSIQNLPKGIYIARFSFDNSIKKYKFFKE